MLYGTDFDVGICEGCDRQGGHGCPCEERALQTEARKVQRPKVGLEGPQSKPQMFCVYI